MEPGLTRIIIADDHPLVRNALRRMLEGQPDLNVLAEAENGQEAVELCRQLNPDLVLMDVRMPKMDGLEATRQIKRELPRTVVLVLTAHESQSYLLEALKAGASGYILKCASQQQLTGAIRRVLEGEPALDQELAQGLLLRLVKEQPARKSANGPAGSSERSVEERPEALLPESLTPREVEVLRLLARGQTNQQIAHNLFISLSTVKKHVERIIKKLGVSDRTQAAIMAIELEVLVD